MNFKLFLIGFLFLINPDLITLDILPDFIGYLLIARSLSRVALLEERLAAAKKYLHLLAITSFFKLLSCLITFPTRIESTRLTVCFLFLIAEGAFSLLFCDHAFKGLQYLAIRKDGDLALKSFDLVKSFTTVFFAVKAAANFLPQLPVVFYANIDAEPDQIENYTQMVSSFRTARSILFLIGSIGLVVLGIYTARILSAYFKKIREDALFCQKIGQMYEENIVQNLSMQTRLAIKGAFFFFFAAFLFLTDLYLDHINMIPKPLFFLCIYLGLKKLCGFVKIKKRMLVFVSVSFFVGLAAYFYRWIRLFTDADFPYTFPYEIPAAIFGILNLMLTVGTAFCALYAIALCAKAYTSYFYQKEKMVLIVLLVVLSLLSFSQYLFVGRSDLVVALEWIFYAVALYFQKNSLDEIQAEAEYKLM